ncbi:MAG TPA: hypothetical protein ENK46_06155 [Flavobacteriia bacterium]|nr:hypothetical protein [Flavobacteriia bacterium]
MNKFILVLLSLFVWNVTTSQDIASDKRYDFAKLFEQVQNESPVFMVTFFKVDKNLAVLAYSSYIVFPIVEEKELLDFSKGMRQKEVKPTLTFGNFHSKKPSFTFHSSFGQQTQGKHKILKGYDYCLRPIY